MQATAVAVIPLRPARVAPVGRPTVGDPREAVLTSQATRGATIHPGLPIAQTLTSKRVLQLLGAPNGNTLNDSKAVATAVLCHCNCRYRLRGSAAGRAALPTRRVVKCLYAPRQLPESPHRRLSVSNLSRRQLFAVLDGGGLPAQLVAGVCDGPPSP